MTTERKALMETKIESTPPTLPLAPGPASPAPPARQGLAISTALVVVDPEMPMRARPWSHRFLALGTVVYSIRMPDPPGAVECARCGQRFLAAGPTGHADDEPICDLCMLECEDALGMVLALIAISRSYAGVRPRTAEQHWDALEELGAFVRIYERAAARSGPAREILRRKPRR
jgi:hypothetical protein